MHFLLGCRYAVDETAKIRATVRAVALRADLAVSEKHVACEDRAWVAGNEQSAC